MSINISDEVLSKYKAFLKEQWKADNVNEYIERLVSDELRKNLVLGYDRDSLTNCKNKYYIKHDFEKCILESKNSDFHVQYICLDIIHFKNYLDHYGISAGEQKLIDVARQIEKNYPNSNIYRYGGDEFILELKDEEFRPLNIPDISLKFSIVNIAVSWDNYIKRNFEREVFYYLERGIFEASPNGTFLSFVYESPKTG